LGFRTVARGTSVLFPLLFGNVGLGHAFIEEEIKENAMKKLLIAASTVGLLAIATVPASADFYAGAGPGGVGVQVGPFGVGVGPRFGWHDDHWYDRPYAHRGHYAYGAADCRIIRERSVTPSGRVIVKRERVCY
jgi:hypothetical protein